MNTRTLPAKDFERADALFRRRKFVNLIAVALANRMARVAWALMRSEEVYRHPAAA